MEVEDAAAVVVAEEDQEDKETEEDLQEEEAQVDQEEGHLVIEVAKVIKDEEVVQVLVLVAVRVALDILEAVNQKLTGIKIGKLEVL